MVIQLPHFLCAIHLFMLRVYSKIFAMLSNIIGARAVKITRVVSLGVTWFGYFG